MYQYLVNTNLSMPLLFQSFMSSIALRIKPTLLGKCHKALNDVALPLPVGSSLTSSPKMHSYSHTKLLSFPKIQVIKYWLWVEHQLQNASGFWPTQ